MRSLRRYLSQRSQSLTEFAIVAPILFLVLFGIIDFGRVIYYYVTLNQAVNEGARVVVRAPTPPNPTTPTQDIDVLNAIKAVTSTVTMQLGPCANGPIDATNPPKNAAYVYVTQPQTGGYTTPPAANAPEGQVTPYPGNTGSNCTAPVAAGLNGQNNAPLQITIRYNFVPVTPLISQVVGNNIVMTAYAVYRTEY